MHRIVIRAHKPRRNYVWNKVGEGNYCWVSLIRTKEERIWIDPKDFKSFRLKGKEMKRVHHQDVVIYTSPYPLHFPADWKPIGFNYRQLKSEWEAAQEARRRR